MSTPEATPLSPAPAIHARRCVRHSTREAAARCPGCGVYFCRECVSEFGGKALCAGCLAKSTKRTDDSTRRWTRARDGVRLVGAIGLTWLSFYAIGRLAAKLPANFHDDTVWVATDTEDAEP